MIILDTQAWLWWLHDPAHLSRRSLSKIRSAEKGKGIRVSAISVWEIAVKTQLGKLERDGTCSISNGSRTQTRVRGR